MTIHVIIEYTPDTPEEELEILRCECNENVTFLKDFSFEFVEDVTDES